MLALHPICSMTDLTPLSPAAQAVLDASMKHSGPAFEPVVRRLVAAALRAAADQVVPEGFADAYDCCLEIVAEIRDDLLAIAAELEDTNE